MSLMEKLLPRPGGMWAPKIGASSSPGSPIWRTNLDSQGSGRRNANESALVPLKGGSPGCSEAISGGRCTGRRRAAPTGWGSSKSPSGLESGAWAFREQADWTRLRTSHKGGSVHSFSVLPSLLPWYPLPPLSGYPSARGRGSLLTAHLPAPAARSCVGGPLPVSLSQASQGQLGRRGRTGCGARIILPLGTAVSALPPARHAGLVCRVDTSCGPH